MRAAVRTCALLLALSLCDPALRAQPRPLDLFQRISLDLRGHRLAGDEIAEIEGAIARHEAPVAIASRYIDLWLTRDVIAGKLDSYLSGPVRADRLFLGYLERVRVDKGSWVYYLPHTLPPDARADAPPCAPADRVEVHPWWSIDQKLQICAPSYRPEHAFDSAGYCAGQAVFGPLPSPPRAGCGCGPLLLACMPPRDENPMLARKMTKALRDEVLETAADIVAADRSFDELMTTSRTWQSGLVAFFYLRRELIARIQHEPWTPTLESALADRVRGVDLAAPGRWVERDGVYRGSGLFTTTIATRTYTVNYRDDALGLLHDFLCADLKSVHVDSDALLKTVTRPEPSEVWNSQVRLQAGCKSCHAPMDNLTGFLANMTDTRWGSQPVPSARVRGELYVKGAGDRRGDGVGFADLSQLLVSQPEFDECAVKHVFQQLVGRPPLNSERSLVDGLVRDFHAGGRRWRALVRSVLLGAPYLAASDSPARGP